MTLVVYASGAAEYDRVELKAEEEYPNGVVYLKPDGSCILVEYAVFDARGIELVRVPLVPRIIMGVGVTPGVRPFPVVSP